MAPSATVPTSMNTSNEPNSAETGNLIESLKLLQVSKEGKVEASNQLSASQLVGCGSHEGSNLQSPMTMMEQLAKGSLYYCLSPEPRSTLTSPLLKSGTAAANGSSQLSRGTSFSGVTTFGHRYGGLPVEVQASPEEHDQILDAPRQEVNQLKSSSQDIPNYSSNPYTNLSGSTFSAGYTSYQSNNSFQSNNSYSQANSYGWENSWKSPMAKPRQGSFQGQHLLHGGSSRYQHIQKELLIPMPVIEDDLERSIHGGSSEIFSNEGDPIRDDLYSNQLYLGNNSNRSRCVLVSAKKEEEFSSAKKAAIGSPDLRGVTGRIVLDDPLTSPTEAICGSVDTTRTGSGKVTSSRLNPLPMMRRRSRALSDFELRSHSAQEIATDSSVSAWRPFYTPQRKASFLKDREYTAGEYVLGGNPTYYEGVGEDFMPHMNTSGSYSTGAYNNAGTYNSGSGTLSSFSSVTSLFSTPQTPLSYVGDVMYTPEHSSYYYGGDESFEEYSGQQYPSVYGQQQYGHEYGGSSRARSYSDSSQRLLLSSVATAGLMRSTSAMPSLPSNNSIGNVNSSPCILPMNGPPQVLPSGNQEHLYIVEFKGGRSEVFYNDISIGVSTSSATPLNPSGVTSSPANKTSVSTSSPFDTLGAWVIVEADRGEDCGFISGRVTHDWLKGHMQKLGTSESMNLQKSNMDPNNNIQIKSPPSVVSNSPKVVYAGCHFLDRSLLLDADFPVPVFLSCKELVPKKIHRLANPMDLSRLPLKHQEESMAVLRCTSRLNARALPMEIVDAEYQWDHNKLTFYYDASSRIDFRELVKELFRIYKTRIWMCATDRKIPIAE